MTAREEALALLRERFPEPREVRVAYFGKETGPIFFGIPECQWQARVELQHPLNCDSRDNVTLYAWRESPLEAARACIAAWDEATAVEREATKACAECGIEWAKHADRLAEALVNCGEHQRGCPWERFEAGRPTESGGYEMQYAGQWYEVKPNDRRPACTCGLNEAIAAHAERRKA